MRTKAWRTVIIDSPESIALKDDCIAIGKNNEIRTLPIEQIKDVMIASSRGSITFPAIARLSQQNANIIFCDGKFTPVCETFKAGNHYERAGRIMDQASWTSRKKESIWRQIVRLKISQQAALLTRCGIGVPGQLIEYLNSVESGDATNREAVAGKLYFRRLFGTDFIRFQNDNTNAALNYGYAVLRSAFNRSIVLHGYRTELGIHHCSRQNPYNLSCDLMEPFRPFVDEIVFGNLGRTLDRGYRIELAALTHIPCRIERREMSIAEGIDEFTASIFESMLAPRRKIKEVAFAEDKNCNYGYV